MALYICNLHINGHRPLSCISTEICTLNDILLIMKKYAYVPASQGRNEKQIYVRTQWACRSETALVKTFQPSQQSLPNSAESTHFNKGSHLKLRPRASSKPNDKRTWPASMLSNIVYEGSLFMELP